VWVRGEWSALFGAAAFALLVNSALLATFVWPELVSPTVRVVTWLAVVIVWAVSAVVAGWSLRELDNPSHRAETEELFRRVQGDYLKGDWYQAEISLEQLLRIAPRDVDAHLMLATLYRHTGRIEEARRQLRLLEQFEQSKKWRLEILHEYEQLD